MYLIANKEIKHILDSETNFEANTKAFESYVEICNKCINIAETDLQEMRNQWEIASLARVFLKYATYMEGFDLLLNYLYGAVSDMAECVIEHPRLKLQLLELQMVVIRRIEAQNGHELSIEEDLSDEINYLNRNISYANNGDFDKIQERGCLKRDPVEWSLHWENIIDQADKIVDERLENEPRGMGFCYSFWHERKIALDEFGIDWKSPKQMNPNVHFD